MSLGLPPTMTSVCAGGECQIMPLSRLLCCSISLPFTFRPHCVYASLSLSSHPQLHRISRIHATAPKFGVCGTPRGFASATTEEDTVGCRHPLDDTERRWFGSGLVPTTIHPSISKSLASQPANNNITIVVVVRGQHSRASLKGQCWCILQNNSIFLYHDIHIFTFSFSFLYKSDVWTRATTKKNNRRNMETVVVNTVHPCWVWPNGRSFSRVFEVLFILVTFYDQTRRWFTNKNKKTRPMHALKRVHL